MSGYSTSDADQLLNILRRGVEPAAQCGRWDDDARRRIIQMVVECGVQDTQYNDVAYRRWGMKRQQVTREKKRNISSLVFIENGRRPVGETLGTSLN